MLKKVAVTGGVASGKTTVCRIFQELGATVVFADEIVHELLKAKTPIGEKIIREFKVPVLKNGALDTKKLSQVFKDAKALKRLERVLHPAVLQRIEEDYARAKGNLFVVEIPLLFEIGAEKGYDVVIAVLSDERLAKKRFKQGEEEYTLRMKRQWTPEEKAARAHFTIHNNGTLEDLRKEVLQVHKKLEIGKN